MAADRPATWVTPTCPKCGADSLELQVKLPPGKDTQEPPSEYRAICRRRCGLTQTVHVPELIP